MTDIVKECIEFIESNRNEELYNILKNYRDLNYSLLSKIYNSQRILYDKAIKCHNIEAFSILFEHGYDNNIYDIFTSNPTEYLNPKLLSHLLNNGFIITRKFLNVLIKSKKNEAVPLLNLIFKKIHFNNDSVLKFLLNFYRNKTPLSDSELNTIIDKEKIKPYKSNIFENESNPYDIPLFIALNEQYEAVLKILIEHGADVNAKIKINYKMIKTPLIISCEYGNNSIIECLIEHGADVNDINGVNITSLGVACEQENEQLIKYLIEHGADINGKVKMKKKTIDFIRH